MSVTDSSFIWNTSAVDKVVIIHMEYGMKMTLNIDDELLARVMEFSGAKTKTEAIANALREMDRRAKLSELLKDDFGMTAEDCRNAIDPAYDLEAMRVAETPAIYKMTPKPNARKSRSGR